MHNSFNRHHGIVQPVMSQTLMTLETRIPSAYLPSPTTKPAHPQPWPTAPKKRRREKLRAEGRAKPARAASRAGRQNHHRRPAQWHRLIRGHWGGVENRNHWSKDAIWREDATRSRNPNLVGNLALLALVAEERGTYGSLSPKPCRPTEFCHSTS